MKKYVFFYISMMISGYVNSSRSDVLVPNAGFMGTLKDERVGYVLSSAGDVNGDGLNDFLIGTFHHSTGGWDAGGVFLILGREDVGTWGMTYSLDNADARFLGTRLEAVGYSIAGGGDVNGDGYDDIVIGAPAGNNQVRYWQGWIYVILGKASADWGRDFYLQYQADAIFEGESGQDRAGVSVAILQDLNGDGCDEILCGAPDNDFGGTNAGKAYLILGKRTGWNRNEKLKFADASFYYAKSNAVCGYSVADIGDVNHDGIEDFAIGAVGVNRVFVFYGRRAANWGLNYNMDRADLIIEGENRLQDDAVGWKVAGVGDVNGDNVSDFLISAIEYNKRGTTLGYGKVFLLFGRAGGWNLQVISLIESDASYIGEDKNDQAGWEIGGLGDINGDGFNDFLVGSWLNDQGYQDAGKAYLIYGKPTGWQRDVELSTITSFFSGEDSVNYAGYAAQIIGDIDGDRRDDMIISAPYFDGFNKWSGKIYLFASQFEKHLLSGRVTYLNSQYAIPHIQIIVTGSQSDTLLTNSNGSYQVEVPGKTNYLITPFKPLGEDVDIECISAFDAALVAQHSVRLHALGNEILTTADINKDGKITSYDAALILKYSLGYPRPSNSFAGEWIFHPDEISIPYLSADQYNHNFYGSIRGDVNSDWVSGTALMKNQIESGAIGLRTEIIDDQLMLFIGFNVYNKILSFDIRLNYPEEVLELLEVRKLATLQNFNLDHYRRDEGVVNMGAFQLVPTELRGDCVGMLFKIHQVKNPMTGSISVERLRLNEVEHIGPKVRFQTNHELSIYLKQNYPNPFNNSTLIHYQIDQPGTVVLHITNVFGQQVFGLREEKMSPGEYSYMWDGKNNSGEQVSSGIYICEMVYDNFKSQIKLLYIR